MKHIQLYIIILISNIIIIACATTSIQIEKNTSVYLCRSIQKKLHNNNYKGAIQDLTHLKNLHVFEPCLQKIYLYLIYTYYKLNDLKSSNETIQQFLQQYPNDQHLDYVLYMHGLINMNLDKDNKMPIKYINICWFDRNPTYAKTAFHSFIKLIHNYPHSPYFLDAYKRAIFLKNRIAEYELSIIKFYDKKNAHISVIMRSKKMLRYFPNTQATHKALPYMCKAYQNIHLYDQADKVMKIISANSIKR